MSSRGGRQDTAREAHVEDVARVFSSAYAGKNTVGFCTFDRDANAFSLAQAIVRDDDEDVLKLFFRTSGADVVYCSSEFKAAIEKMSDARATTIVEMPRREFGNSIDAMEKLRDVGKFESRGDLASVIELHDNEDAVIAAGGLIGALRRNEGLNLQLKTFPANVQEFNVANYLSIDIESLCAIGVFVPEEFRENQFTKDMFQIFREACGTSSGRKLLELWFKRPILNMDVLQERRDAVEHFVKSGCLNALRKRMTPTIDAHCLLSAMSSNDARVVLQTKSDWTKITKYLGAVSSLYDFCVDAYFDEGLNEPSATTPTAIRDFMACVMYRLPKLRAIVDRVICVEEIYPLTEHESAVYTSYVRSGVCQELDELRSVYHGLPDLLKHVLDAELTKVPNFLRRANDVCEKLAICYLPQTGYLLKIDDETVPDALLEEMDWKYVFGDATTSYYEFAAGLCLANELGDVLHSIVDLQESILRELREEILEHASLMRDISRCVSEIDVLLAFADIAVNYNMCRPTLRDDDAFEVAGARHPLYESFIEGEFIGNDVHMPTDRDRVIVLTGPNGSGKTVMMQTIGLITYLAHCGSFVPATRAVIGLTDRIYTAMTALREDAERKTRVPESGFTYALHQVARMINNATRRSLCLVDEFGIQTQSTDGAALLAAIVEHFGKRKHPPRVLFTTHFREVCDPTIVGPIPHMVAHWCMRAMVNPSATDDDDVHEVEMLFKLERGVADSSFALSACKRVGFPDEFMDRLKYIIQREKRARAGEDVPPLDPWADPKQDAKQEVYKAIWERFERARADPTDAAMEDFLAFFDSLALDKYGVPIV